MSENDAIQVLIVDDNARYREAFARNLVIEGMQVVQAADGDQALSLLRSQQPDVMVTDLQMRTATEGLDLIRSALAQDPCLPIIMISAVGSFDEGAMASKLGAAHVLSKARIEEEMSVLYDCIRQSYARYREANAALDEISELRAETARHPEIAEEALKRLHALIEDATLHDYVRSEAFDLITILSETQLTQISQDEIKQAMEAVEMDAMRSVEQNLAEQIPDIESLDADTRGSMRIAEYLFQHSEALGSDLELARTTCFSYCFSVENQAKSNLRKRLQRFLTDKDTFTLITSLQEKKSNHIDMFFQQYILQTMRDYQMDFSVDNVRQTFMRVQEHQARYRPDGLKALGILILTFGRTYEFRQGNQTMRINNPLGIKGLDDDEEVLHFAELLISLQHLRNPYIHPEISGREGIEIIRQKAIECLNILAKIK